jgi:hypothetical protein
VPEEFEGRTAGSTGLKFFVSRQSWNPVYQHMNTYGSVAATKENLRNRE